MAKIRKMRGKKYHKSNSSKKIHKIKGKLK